MNPELKYFADKIRRKQVKYGKNRPFRAIFGLSAPVQLNHPWILFDGLVAHINLMRALGDDYYLLPAKYSLGRAFKGGKLGVGLPLAQTDNSLWHASASVFEPQALYLETIYKRFEDKYFTGVKTGKKAIYSGQGYFRAHALQLPYLAAETVTFYGRGDLTAIREICALVPGIGAKTAIGFGAVREFEVVETEADYSLVKDGRAMRPLPVRLLRRWSDQALLAWRPPYWSADSVELCAPPGAEVDICRDCR